MTKVVYNSCYGGFSLSEDASNALLERRPDLDMNPKYGHVPYDLSRDDADLVWVVEFFGVEKAGGRHAALAIQEMPDGIPFQVEEYDGNETVVVDFRKVCELVSLALGSGYDEEAQTLLQRALDA